MHDDRSEREEGKGVNLDVVETEWEVKNFHDILERGRGGGEFGVETERYMTFFREQIKLRVALSMHDFCIQGNAIYLILLVQFLI